MRHHPLTPMTDANLVRVLRPADAAQGRAGAVRAIVAARRGGDPRRASTRCGRDGVALRDRRCDRRRRSDRRSAPRAPTCRWSPAARASRSGCRANFRARGLLAARRRRARCRASTARPRCSSGSCSDGDARQVARSRAAHRPSRSIRCAATDRRTRSLRERSTWSRRELARGGPVLIYSTRRARRGRARCRRSSGASARRALVEQRARARSRARLVEHGVRRLVVAGGETSGAVVQALGVEALRIGPQIDPGVPWTTSARRAAARARAQVRQLRRARISSPRRSVAIARDERRAHAARARSSRSARSLFERGLTHGSTGNVSAQLDDGWLMTPTGLEPRPARPGAALRSSTGRARSSPATRRPRRPFLHLAMYASAPRDARGRAPAFDALGRGVGAWRTSIPTTCCRRSPPTT